MNDNFLPTPQAILNQALRELAKSLDAAQKSRELLLKQLKDSSPVPDLQRYGVVSTKRKGEAYSKIDSEKFKKDTIEINTAEVARPEEW